MPTPIDIVIEECSKLGVTVDAKKADFILWTHTGWPGFWPDRSITPEENLRKQIREWANNERAGKNDPPSETKPAPKRRARKRTET